jgi:nucleoside-diphosphate-sugar epimerase
MTILVTGGAGFIANTLVDSILSRGDSVICLDNLCRGTRQHRALLEKRRVFDRRPCRSRCLPILRDSQRN